MKGNHLMNPYEILEISPSADDAAIRATYLKLVRRFPPEQHPDRFAEINRAYEMIKDREHRLEYTLFPPAPEEKTPMETAIVHFRRKNQRVPVSFQEMKHFLQSCAQD